MPVLPNIKHERFAQALAKGSSQADAYVKAGYKPSEPHASRLASDGKVSARVAELLERAANSTIETVATMASQLDEDREFARELKQASAAVAASMGKAKVLGLIVDKVQANVTNADVSDAPITEDAWTEQVAGHA